jgi:hypothetical protein
VPLKGSDPWSIRSRPHVAAVCVVNVDISPSGSTYATFGSARSAFSDAPGTSAE